VLLRQTDTGNLHSISFYSEEPLDCVDENGEHIHIPACARVLAVWDDSCRAEWVEQKLDGLELMLHASHSAKFSGASIKTSYDIRTAGRRYDVGSQEELPF